MTKKVKKIYMFGMLKCLNYGHNYILKLHTFTTYYILKLYKIINIQLNKFLMVHKIKYCSPSLK